ncbi:ATP-dependent endonuclease [Micromonospora sp. WMMD1102]|uniref:TOPRIM nucleotidyl transferase/hydrolase domain-containing protein n=1 Tax=Micromonospora sp. WMMD1102 TaxID=3016105 RepID=UPI002414FEB7|nr:TOPRIM nucleotidyl transferase/hydrolase domain-containing protein [Micromonospora sp. WMMD1102]MDG4787926.1 ATP-dependent endonuclease [Micromonospora sp. WMMD1102]
MDVARRRELARRALDGYVSGHGAPVRATARALAKFDSALARSGSALSSFDGAPADGGSTAVGADSALALLLVEGISDQIAVETAAVCRGLDLDAERVVVVPIGGAHAIGRFLTGLGPPPLRVRLAGLCDLAEAEIFRRGLRTAGVGAPDTEADLGRLGFQVCVDDLEDELIRAVGVEGVQALFDSQGDLGSFRSLQRQPAWRGRETGAQLRRFLGSGSRRKSRYARLLVEEAVARNALPRPLDALLRTVCPPH